jgi:hypothetical protein
MFIVVCCISLYGLQNAAQTPSPKQPPSYQQTPPTFKVQSNLVVIDATVRDKKGNLIKDLKKENFTIFEDNVPQTIVTFAVENIPDYRSTLPPGASMTSAVDRSPG